MLNKKLSYGVAIGTFSYLVYYGTSYEKNFQKWIKEL